MLNKPIFIAVSQYPGEAELLVPVLMQLQGQNDYNLISIAIDWAKIIQQKLVENN